MIQANQSLNWHIELKLPHLNDADQPSMELKIMSPNENISIIHPLWQPIGFYFQQALSWNCPHLNY